MTDDLVKRLRIWAQECNEQHGPGMWAQDMGLAADRIEELEEQIAASDRQIKHLESEIENLECEICAPNRRTTHE